MAVSGAFFWSKFAVREDLVWINAAAIAESHEGKTLEEIGREFRDALIAASEGRWEDTPAWLAASVDVDPMGGDEEQ
jgi:hypothetical protein